MFRTKPDADSIKGIMEELYTMYGSSSIYDYFNGNHPNNEWNFCNQCEADTPVLECKKYRVCAVCGATIPSQRTNYIL